MDIDFGYLRCFKAVAEAGSVSKASLALGLSQPAISIQIKKLEAQVGKSLFERTNRGLYLTSTGERLLEVAMRATELQHDVQSILSSHDEPRGRLRIGTYTTASSYLLAAPMKKFLDENSGVSICYHYDPVEVMLAKIKTKELEAAVLSDFNRDATLEAVSIWKDRMVFVGTKEQADRLPKKLKPSDLSKIDFLSYPLRLDLCYQRVEKLLGKHLVRANVVCESTSFDTLKQMLLLGTGVTFMPHYLVQNEIKDKRLRVMEIEGVDLPVEFSFVSRGDHSSSAGVIALKKLLLAWFKKTVN
jgi:DNA-binding transcriptional LysR family regulator